MDWNNNNSIKGNNDVIKNRNRMIDVTPFFLFESTGDSEEPITDDHLPHHPESTAAAAMDSPHHQRVLSSFQELQQQQEQGDDDDDDAQSCSSDHGHSFYTNIGTHHDHDHDHDQDELEADHGGSVIYHHQEEEEDDDDEMNWADSKMKGSNVKQKRSSCVVDNSSSLNQREYDKRFWEACLAS